MNGRRLAPRLGVVACLATLAALLAPFVLLSDTGTGLGLYYGSGPFGAGVVGFLATLLVIVFLSGVQERRDPAIVAGVAAVGTVALVAFAVIWATAVDRANVLSFPAAWMGWHRWLVCALAAVSFLTAVAFTRETI